MSVTLPGREIGIVVALPAEADSLLGSGHWRAGRFVARSGACVAMAGVGAERARIAAERLQRQGVRALMSWGVVGALVPGLQQGDVLVPSRVSGERGEWVVDEGWRDALVRSLPVRDRALDARLWCSDTPVVSVQDKRRLAERGLHAVDMESAAVAEVAERAGLPFVAVKAVCDPASRALPLAAVALLNDDGRVSLRGLARAVLGGPGLWRDLNQLRRDFDAAHRALSQAARGLPMAWTS